MQDFVLTTQYILDNAVKNPVLLKYRQQIRQLDAHFLLKDTDSPIGASAPTKGEIMEELAHKGLIDFVYDFSLPQAVWDKFDRLFRTNPSNHFVWNVTGGCLFPISRRGEIMLELLKNPEISASSYAKIIEIVSKHLN